ncbi:MAG: hypothetical protein IPG70_14240 [Moraxellaceae bacterium]|nr:hypothetical protein [Moraxellaceae bacterium]
MTRNRKRTSETRLAASSTQRLALNPKPLTPHNRICWAEDWAADEADLQQQLEHVAEQTQPQTPPKPNVPVGRQALPAHLTRIDVRHEPASCTCGDCGRALTLIRDEVVEN